MNLKYQKFNRTFYRQLLSLDQFNEVLKKKLDLNRFDEIFNTPVVRNFKNMNQYTDETTSLASTTTTITTTTTIEPIIVINSQVIQRNNDQYENDEDYYYNDYYGKDSYNYEDEYEVEKSTKRVPAPIFYNNTMPGIESQTASTTRTTTTDKPFILYQPISEDSEPRLVDDYEEEKVRLIDNGQNKYDYYYEDYDASGEIQGQSKSVYDRTTRATSNGKTITISNVDVDGAESPGERNLRKLKNYLVSYYESGANKAISKFEGSFVFIAVVVFISQLFLSEVFC